jgi:hypothetical protein
MPEFFSSFPSLDIKPQTTNLSEMINTARGAQAFKSGEIALEQQTVANDEQRKIADAIKQNPDLFMTNNRLDMDKVNSIIPILAPRTGATYLQQYSILHGAQTTALDAKRGFDQSIKSQIGTQFRVLGETGNEDPAAVFALAKQLKDQYSDQPDVQRYLDAAVVPFKMTSPGPHVPQMLIRGAQSLLTPAEQEATFGTKTGTMNLGTDIVQWTQKARPGGLPQQITVNTGQPLAQAQLTPGELVRPTNKTDLNGNPTEYVYSLEGDLLGERTIEAGVPPGAMPGAQIPGPLRAPTGALPPTNVAPPANAPFRMPRGESAATLDAANKLRIAARTAAATVPNLIDFNNKIIELAPNAITGQGASTLAAYMGGYAGIPLSSDNATNLNLLGDYMAKTQVQLAQNAGFDSDASRALTAETVGTTSWTTKAIQSTARTNRALATATKLFYDGIDNEFNRTKNPFSPPEFQQRWNKTLGTDGIKAIRLYDATLNHDNEAIREVVNSIGGKDSAEYKKLVAKIGSILKLTGAQ